MVTVDEIVNLIPSPEKTDIELIKKAYIFAQESHKSHSRFSGEPYFTHLAETAKILASYGMGSTTIAAGLLHDTLEDVEIGPEKLEKEFGGEILFLIEGVTKLGKLRYHGTDRHNESLRKLFVAMSEDIRVLMIKLADRLHNMRTLSYIPEEKQKRIATETLEIYAPIAYRLGIRKLSRELEDLAFPFVFPEEWKKLQELTKQKYEEDSENLEKFLKSIKKVLAKENIPFVRTEYRVKGLYSLYKKIQTKKKHPEEVHDILAARILVKEIQDCYRVLGMIHATWRPLPGRIKDYIAFPKPNGYQALHTTVFTGDGNIVEVQIKTEEMYRDSEFGIASHIAYKAGKSGKKIPENLEWIEHLMPKHAIDHSAVQGKGKYEDVPGWIRELVEHHTQEKDHETFREDLRKDFFEHRIFVFSPMGDVVDLPAESTPVDFAYSIHSAIGNHMSGAKVNGKLVSLDTKLHNGDIVEITTKSSAKPSTKWIEYAKTTMAKRHIRSAIQKSKRSQ